MNLLAGSTGFLGNNILKELGFNKSPTIAQGRRPVSNLPDDAEELIIDFDNLENIFDCDEINMLDGIKFSWPDKWIHIRKSNTEPIIRIFAEAPTQDKVDELVNTLKNYVK